MESCGRFSWSDLVLDRSRKLVGLQSPAACATRAVGDSDPNFENYDLFHAQSPDTGHRTRCSRPFVAGEPGCRRQALVSWVLFEGVLVGSLLLDGPIGEKKSHSGWWRWGFTHVYSS